MNLFTEKLSGSNLPARVKALEGSDLHAQLCTLWHDFRAGDFMQVSGLAGNGATSNLQARRSAATTTALDYYEYD